MVKMALLLLVVLLLALLLLVLLVVVVVVVHDLPRVIEQRYGTHARRVKGDG